MLPEITSNRSLGTVAVGYDATLRVFPDVGGLGKSITPERFAAAVERAVVDSGLFTGTAPRERADFLLDATAINVEIDVIDGTLGYVLAYHVVAEWKLRRASDSRVLFNEIIASKGRANFGDALNGITRNTVARENGARKNIEEGTRRLSASEL